MRVIISDVDSAGTFSPEYLLCVFVVVFNPYYKPILCLFFIQQRMQIAWAEFPVKQTEFDFGRRASIDQ